MSYAPQMSNAVIGQATYADILNLPDNVTGEIVNGVLYQQPRPAPKHAFASSRLGAAINPPFDLGKNGPGGWWILDEPECHLGVDILVPDIAGWRRERMPSLPKTAWFELPPDWVCEVLSPSTASKDRIDKQSVYAREGVGFLWFIDPDAKTLEAFRLESGSWLLIAALGGDDQAGVPPFDDVPFCLGELWA